MDGGIEGPHRGVLMDASSVGSLLNPLQKTLACMT